jgi:hypothetical protein
MRRTVTSVAAAVVVTALCSAPAPAADPPVTGALKQVKTDRARAEERDNRAARQAMNKSLPEVKLENIPLNETIDFVRDISGANIHVNWRALEEVNVTRETPVSLRLQQVPLRKLLRIILDGASPDGLLTFYTEDGVIEVTTKALADKKMITKVYTVEDLLMEIPNFDDPPDFQLGQTARISGGGGGGGGQSIISGSSDREEQRTTKDERGNELVALIMDTIRPDVWRENGGTASIRYFRGQLIVTAPRSVHESLGG